MRYFMHLAYKGEKYHGWQRQKSVTSIQQVIEETLERMLHHPIRIHGCGRTDAGVHADQYFAHFDTDQNWDYDPVRRINKMLPSDIAVYDFLAVEENANVQKDAFLRTYDYFIHFQSQPFLNEFSTYYDGRELNLDAIVAGANILTQYKDFRSLCKSPDKIPHTRCNLSEVNVYQHKDGQRLRFELSSNRFLRGMIRLIITKLLDIGQGKINLEEWKDFLSKNENPSYKKFAPPQGLHLSKINYRYLNIPSQQSYENWIKLVSLKS